MGTPDFALPSLDALIGLAGHEVAAVVTQPDRPGGRGLHLLAPPVKKRAMDHGIPTLQPERLGDRSFQKTLRALGAELFVVVAFRILPPSVFSMPARGAINLHASLLPKYRGAAPIQWAIINGERETGVTTFLIERQVDTGNILLQRRVAIEPDETAGMLHDRLALIGAQAVVDTVEGVASARLRPVPQTGEPSPAPKLSREDGRIDWRLPATVIHNRIRGLNPFPMGFTGWRTGALRLLRSAPAPCSGTDAPGTVVRVDQTDGPVIQTGEGCLRLLTVQPEGRKIMSGVEFSRGYRPVPGERLGDE